MGTQKLSLKWKNHHSNLVVVFNQLLDTEMMVDVTLACEGLSLKAHKIVLSSCSNFFKTLFCENPCQHPIVILKDIDYIDLKTIIEFMYHGKVDVPQDRWGSFLHTAEILKIKGLTEVASELGSSMQSQKNTATGAAKRKPKRSVKKATSVKQRKINTVVPVSLQKAKPSSNWQMLDLTEMSAVSSNKNTDEEMVLPISAWASEISEKLKLNHTGHSSSSASSIDDSSSSSSCHVIIDDNSQAVCSYASQQSNSISFFTAPIAALHSALEGTEFDSACKQTASHSQEDSNKKDEQFDEFNTFEEESKDEEDSNYILPTEDKLMKVKGAGKRTIDHGAITSSSKPIYKKLAQFYAGVEDKSLQVDFEEPAEDEYHSKDDLMEAYDDDDDVVVLQKMHAESEPVESNLQENGNLPKSEMKKTHKAVPGSKRRKRLHMAARRRVASRKLNQVQKQFQNIEEVTEKIDVHVDSVKDKPGKDDENYCNIQQDGSSAAEEKEKKRERRPPKKYDNFVVGASIPLFEEPRIEMPKLKPITSTSTPKNKLAVKKQNPPKATSQKRNVVPRAPILAEKDERIHLGHDVWIEESDWIRADRTETDRQFCSTLASGIWGNNELLERGVTGKALVGAPKRPLSPFKVNIIRERLTDRLVSGNIVPEDLNHRIKQVNKYLSDHILSLTRRRERAFMKQRQQQST